jgi:hypothetical protein
MKEVEEVEVEVVEVGSEGRGGWVKLDEDKNEQGWVDTNALRRVGVELDDEWEYHQADAMRLRRRRRRRRGHGWVTVILLPPPSPN